MMTIQINIRMNEDFLEKARKYAKSMGFLNVQEFFREAAREKLFEDQEVRPKYIKRLKSKEANTFSSVKDSERFIEGLRKKAGM